MRLKVINPYDQKVIAELPFDRGETLEAEVSGAHAAYGQWHRLALEERTRRVEQGLCYFRNHADEIAHDITLQMGKPLAQAAGELRTFLPRAEYMLSIAKETLASEILPAKPDQRNSIAILNRLS